MHSNTYFMHFMQYEYFELFLNLSRYPYSSMKLGGGLNACLSVMLVENGRYGNAPIRSNTSIRVCTTADTIRVLRALVSQPLVLLDKAGRLENADYTQWVAHTDHSQQTNLCAQSVL